MTEEDRYYEILHAVETLFEFHRDFFETLSTSELMALKLYYALGAPEVTDIPALRRDNAESASAAEAAAMKLLSSAGIVIGVVDGATG